MEAAALGCARVLRLPQAIVNGGSVPSLAGLFRDWFTFPALTCRNFLCRRCAAGVSKSTKVFGFCTSAQPAMPALSRLYCKRLGASVPRFLNCFLLSAERYREAKQSHSEQKFSAARASHPGRIGAQDALPAIPPRKRQGCAPSTLTAIQRPRVSARNLRIPRPAVTAKADSPVPPVRRSF